MKNNNKLPNIIYIYADDLGKGMLSCYGQQYFSTPNIDRIANEGMLFERAYANSFCAPARASLICGIHDVHAGRWTYTPGAIYKKMSIGELTQEEIEEVLQHTGIESRANNEYIATILKKKGYVTGEIGKLEWGFATSNYELQKHGWDYHYGYYDHIQCHGFYPPFLFENGIKIDIEGNTDPHCGRPEYNLSSDANKYSDRKGRKVYSQDLFDDKIMEFINEHKDEPFFLFHPSQLPHGPVYYPEYHPAIKDNDDLLPIEKEYASMVLRLDDTVGKILDEIERLGLTDNTLFIFASDNGHTNSYYQVKGRTQTNETLDGRPTNEKDNPFRTETCGDIFNGNDGLAGLKFSNWDGGNRICFMAKWDGVIKSGSICNNLISNYDTLATLADIVDAPIPEGTDGLSYLPMLKSEEKPIEHEYVVFAARTGPALVTKDGWKLRFYVPEVVFNEAAMSNLNIPFDERVSLQLYNVLEDPAEKNDVAKEYPDIVKELLKKLVKECDGNIYNGTPNAHHVQYTIDVPNWARIVKGEI